MFFHDYNRLHYEDFILKVYGVQGDFKKIMELRHLALFGKHTKYNKEEVKQGKKLFNDVQKKWHAQQVAEREKQRASIMKEHIDNLYLQKLKERGLIN